MMSADDCYHSLSVSVCKLHHSLIHDLGQSFSKTPTTNSTSIDNSVPERSLESEKDLGSHKKIQDGRAKAKVDL